MIEYKVGDMRNGTKVLPIKDRKTILLLSDDLRMSSGVGTMSKEFVFGMLHRYKFYQIGGAMKHPDEGKLIDMCDTVRNQTGIEDAYLKIYPVSGYGEPGLVRHIMNEEKPDLILHFTDPRFWGWLYQMEHEIRQTTPIAYYTIWDDLPFPRWNEPFYESCDLLLAISKQTHNIVKNVIRKYPKEDWQIRYVPHGIDENVFFPITELHEKWVDFTEFRRNMLGEFNPDFVVFWNNRNIRRKLPGDVILAYKTFCDKLPKEKADKCLLLMHTQPVDSNGTDLPAVVREICPDYRVLFSTQKFPPEKMNYLYNMADVTVNIASNEGFGLSSAESLMSGTPIINSVTGGLQDQVGFKKDDGSYITIDDLDSNWGSNHDGRYTEHGEWAKIVFPACRSLQGSPQTPYIFDDRVKWEDVADKIKEWYDTDNRKECGLAGREFVLSDDSMMSSQKMCENFIEYMDEAIEKFEPRKRFTLYKAEEKQYENKVGINI